MSFTINSHGKTNRIQNINIKHEDLNKLVFPFKKHTITSLEYKPFSRFSLAKSLDEVFENKLSKTIVEILKDRNTGTVIVEPQIDKKKFDKDFLVKLSTGFVKEKTDWLIMTKMEEQGVSGGESVILHLDDWEYLDELSNNPVGQQDFIWGSPKSKNVQYKVEHPVFKKDKEGKPIISYIDQFPEPKNMEQGLFLQRLSDCLEESKNKIEFPLPVGSTIFSNNYFWLHGRKPFKENTNLSRELMRIRGTFFN